MFRINKVFLIALMTLVCLFSGDFKAQAHSAGDSKPAEAVNHEDAEISLNARERLRITLKKTPDEQWTKNITAVYLFPARMSNDIDESAFLTSKNLLDKKSYLFEGNKMSLDSRLFSVQASEAKPYDIVIQSKGYADYEVHLLVKNLRPLEFTIRSIDKNGKVRKIKSYTYDEMVKMSNSEEYYSIGCVMHGLISMKGRGVYLKDLLKDADGKK